MHVLPASERIAFRRGPFQIQRIQPGRIFHVAGGDTGIAGLGLIDHAHLDQGLLVAMHEHRNDEIVSYLVSGEMVHEDSHGARAVLSRQNRMAMNAGVSFWHEESVPIGKVEMLQIFVRPEMDDLRPHLQFGAFPDAEPTGMWRTVFGPAGTDVPMFVRQRVRMAERQLRPGEEAEVPAWEGFDINFLYVFNGKVTVEGRPLSAGDSTAWLAKDAQKEAKAGPEGCLLTLFGIDSTARYSRSGTLSG